jgi:hypothetical protein
MRARDTADIRDRWQLLINRVIAAKRKSVYQQNVFKVAEKTHSRKQAVETMRGHTRIPQKSYKIIT